MNFSSGKNLETAAVQRYWQYNCLEFFSSIHAMDNEIMLSYDGRDVLCIRKRIQIVMPSQCHIKVPSVRSMY